MRQPWKLKRTVQCLKCPWLKSLDPRTIPNGYTREKHEHLACTIAEPGVLEDDAHVMACHENHTAHCIGWVHNQMGDGNNIPLRLKMTSCLNARDIRIIGPQHATFQDTIPKD